MELLNVLCEEVRREPQDEERWLVLADALMDVGEPRGELVALTSPDVGRRARRRHPQLEWWRRLPEDIEVRIAALTDEAAWSTVLGLPEVRGRRVLTWHRGAVGTVAFHGGRGIHVLRTLDALMGHWSGRLWVSLSLWGLSPSPRNARRIVGHEGIRGLQKLIVDGQEQLFDAVLAADLQLRELAILRHGGQDFDRVADLLDAPWIGQLTSLSLPGIPSPASIERLATCERLRNLRWLDVHPQWSDRVGGRGPTMLEPLYESPVLADCAIYPPPPRDRRSLPRDRRPYRRRR